MASRGGKDSTGLARAAIGVEPGPDNARHELFLRGVLGETRSLLLRPPPADRVDPRDGGLRLILGLATAFKTIEGVAATQPGTSSHGSWPSARRCARRSPDSSRAAASPVARSRKKGRAIAWKTGAALRASATIYACCVQS
jgi:hypothetical protein